MFLSHTEQREQEAEVLAPTPCPAPLPAANSPDSHHIDTVCNVSGSQSRCEMFKVHHSGLKQRVDHNPVKLATETNAENLCSSIQQEDVHNILQIRDTCVWLGVCVGPWLCTKPTVRPKSADLCHWKLMSQSRVRTDAAAMETNEDNRAEKSEDG